MSDSGTATLGIMVARQAAQEEEDDHDHQGDGEHQFKLHVVHRSLNAGGHVGQGGDMDGRGKIGFQLRQDLLDAIDDGDGVGAGLALDVENDRRASCSSTRPGVLFSTPLTTLATSLTKTGAPLL